MDEKETLCGLCKEDPGFSSHECLACGVLCCWPCASAHVRSPRFAHHKILGIQGRDVCVKHNQELLFYCLDEEVPVCFACAQFSVEHSAHRILDFPSAFLTYSEEYNRLIREFEYNEKEGRRLLGAADAWLSQVNAKTAQAQHGVAQMERNVLDTAGKELGCYLAKLKELKQARLLKLQFEEVKARDLLQQINSVVCPQDAQAQLIEFLPVATSLLLLPMNDPADFTLDAPDAAPFSAFSGKLESAIDGFKYGTMTPSKKWTCKECTNKNTAQSLACVQCRVPNKFLEKLNCIEVKVPTKRARFRRI